MRDRHRAEAGEEINRLIRVRSSTRAVLSLQQEAVDSLAAGHEVEVGEFAPGMSASLADLRDAADSVLLDGWLIPVSQESLAALPERGLGRLVKDDGHHGDPCRNACTERK